MTASLWASQGSRPMHLICCRSECVGDINTRRKVSQVQNATTTLALPGRAAFDVTLTTTTTRTPRSRAAPSRLQHLAPAL
eukprot:4547029-Prymnesium_polylepis.1